MARSLLLEILQLQTAATLLKETAPPEVVSRQVLTFPFLAIVGQAEMKTALVLNVINPAVAACYWLVAWDGQNNCSPGLVDLMPPVRRSLCPYAAN